jgi:RimJ/RimL family protein N-acetyltransferase
MTLLVGSLVRLRPYNRTDVEPAWRYVNNPEVKRFLVPGVPLPFPYEAEEKWFQDQVNTKGDGTFNLAIESLADGKYIGGCGVNEMDWKNGVATVGIFLGSDFWGKGFGTDAMRVLLHFLFTEMNVHKVDLKVYSFNQRAMKSYEHCGFKLEGVLRQSVYREGAYRDECIMGILREEWEALQASTTSKR